LVFCNGAPFGLQAAYNTGNTITTTDGRDIAFTLDDSVTTDANFTIQTAAGSTGYTYLSLADGSNATPPSQLLLVENLDTDEVLQSGITFQSAGGGITNAIDATDTDIVNALNAGSNNIAITTGTIGSNAATSIDFAEFDVASGTGSVTINDGGDAGQLLVEGTNLDINSLDFVGAGTITSSGATLTLNSGNNTITFDSSDTALS